MQKPRRCRRRAKQSADGGLDRCHGWGLKGQRFFNRATWCGDAFCLQAGIAKPQPPEHQIGEAGRADTLKLTFQVRAFWWVRSGNRGQSSASGSIGRLGGAQPPTSTMPHARTSRETGQILQLGVAASRNRRPALSWPRSGTRAGASHAHQGSNAPLRHRRHPQRAAGAAAIRRGCCRAAQDGAGNRPERRAPGAQKRPPERGGEETTAEPTRHAWCRLGRWAGRTWRGGSCAPAPLHRRSNRLPQAVFRPSRQGRPATAVVVARGSRGTRALQGAPHRPLA